MNDTRNQILDQLEIVLGNVTGVTAVFRNRGKLPDDPPNSFLPAAVLLDGKERLISDIPPLKTRLMPPAIFCLEPQIFIILEPRDTPANTTISAIAATPIGEELSSYRMQVLTTVVNDPGLLNLLGPNGQIVYTGCDTDMQTGSTMLGQLQMHFEFYYVLFPPRP